RRGGAGAYDRPGGGHGRVGGRSDGRGRGSVFRVGQGGKLNIAPPRRSDQNLFLSLNQSRAAYSVCSPPPCGEGLGVGSRDSLAGDAIVIFTAPPPSPPLPPTQVGLARLAQDKTRPGRARG